ncbi:MAG: cold shock domain-containing protein [Acidobacteriota bacterium]
MPKGKIVKLFKDKGYGFIRSEEAAKDLFFHRSAIKEKSFDMLEINDHVEFEFGESAKGPRAENVIPNAEAMS